MLKTVLEIVGSAEVTAYERLALYEDRDQLEPERCYTEALYHGESGYFLVVENNLFAISQRAAFSWLNRRGFHEIMLSITRRSRAQRSCCRKENISMSLFSRKNRECNKPIREHFDPTFVYFRPILSHFSISGGSTYTVKRCVQSRL